MVSKLFRAYGLYNTMEYVMKHAREKFQSSFELTGYITSFWIDVEFIAAPVSKLFRAYGLYNNIALIHLASNSSRFKALSSLRVI